MFEWLFQSSSGEVLDIMQVIASDLTKMHLAAMAQEKAACMIAKAIAKSEIVLTDGKQRRKDEAYFRLNIRPNDNQTGTDLWFEVVRQLMLTGNCVVVRMNGGKYYRAVSYNMDEYVMFPKTYRDIVVTDGYHQFTLAYGIPSDDIMHFRYSSDKMRMWVDSVIASLDSAMDAVQALETISHTPLFKYKVDANLTFRRKVNGQDVRLSIDEVIEDFKNKINDGKLAIIPEQAGTTLEYMDIRAGVTAQESQTMADLINKECAAAYDIPIGVFNGSILEQSDAINEFVTFAVSPVVEIINDTLNAKLVGMSDYIRGERAFVWLARFKHIDVTDSANSLDKLRAIGFTLDEIFEMVGYPALNTEFSTARALTKNYTTEGVEESGGDGPADDPAEESIANKAARKPSKHKERRERRARTE